MEAQLKFKDGNKNGGPSWMNSKENEAVGFLILAYKVKKVTLGMIRI